MQYCWTSALLRLVTSTSLLAVWVVMCKSDFLHFPASCITTDCCLFTQFVSLICRQFLQAAMLTACSIVWVFSDAGDLYQRLQEYIQDLGSEGAPLPSSRHHRSNGDCLEGKRENYQVYSVQYCVQQLCTVQCTHIWTDLTVLWIGFCLTGSISLCLDSFVYCVSLYIVCMRRFVTRWGGPGGIEASLRTTTSFSALTLSVGSFDPKKTVPKMTYYVFSGTLNPAHSQSRRGVSRIWGGRGFIRESVVKDPDWSLFRGRRFVRQVSKKLVIFYRLYCTTTTIDYGPLSGTTRLSRYQKKHSPILHPDHHPIFISFFHLLRSIALSLFKLRAWQSFCTTSLQILFGLPLGLGPSTSYSIHFFTQSVSSSRSTCPYHRNLLCCSITIISSVPSLSLNYLLGTLSFTLTLRIHLAILISARWYAKLYYNDVIIAGSFIQRGGGVSEPLKPPGFATVLK